LLLPEYQFTAPDKETLCRIVSFERFLNWVNEDLVKARWIEIIVWPGRGSAAKLIKDDMPELKWGLDRYRVIQALEGGGYVMQTKESETEQHSDDTILWILRCRNNDASTRSISLLG